MSYFTFAGLLTGTSFEDPSATVSILGVSDSETDLQIVDYGIGLTTGASPGAGGSVTVTGTGSHSTGRTALGDAGAPDSLLDEVLTHLVDHAGDATAGSVSTYLGTGGHSSDAADVLAVEIDGQIYVYVAENTGSGITVFGPADGDALPFASQVTDGADSFGAGISALASVQIGAQSLLFSGSATEHGIDCFQINPDGSLTLLNSLGPGEHLPVQSISSIEPVILNGTPFLIVAAAGSSSLTILEIGADGGLHPTDQIIDTLHTRFQNVSVLEVIEKDGQVFVLAAGADDGISLFTLLPDGHLVHIETIEDSNEAGLTNISDIEAHVAGDEVLILVTSAVEAGVSVFTLDLTDLGAVTAGSSGVVMGTAMNDSLLLAAAGELIGGDGDDILQDGAGANTLTGGAGRDVFVLIADGETDTILDYQPGLDQIDLSFFPMLYSLSQMDVTYTGDGAILVYGSETIVIHTASGTALTEFDLQALVLVDVSRTYFAPPDLSGDLELIGSEGADLLVGGIGNDLLDGLGGNDTLEGDIGADRLLGGEKNDILSGGDGDDILFGELGADTLSGDAGQDTLYGGWGGDLLFGGDGNDRLEGFGQNDRLFGGTGSDALFGDDGNDFLHGGWGSDWMFGGNDNDRLEGFGQNDFLFGEAGADNLYGDEGNDQLNGGWGSDRLYGGVGNDTLLGGHQNDFLYGQAGADVLDGGTGDDYLHGGWGSDDLTGGSGIDTFVFSDGFDTISDFTDNVDTVALDASLLGIAGLTAQNVVDQFATTIGGNAALDFGNGDILVFNGLTDPALLVDDILFV